MDGSCKPHMLPELWRAAWSIITMDQQGNLLLAARGTAPWPLPQTSHVAEACAYIAYLQITAIYALPDQHIIQGTMDIQHGSIGYSDCLAIVQGHGKPRAKKLSRTSPWAGLFLQAMTERESHIQELRKVKAHVNPKGLTGDDWYLAAANEHADSQANAARDLHGSAGTKYANHWEALDDEVEKVSAAADYAARVASLWPEHPRLEKEHGSNSIRPMLGIGHPWRYSLGAWTCRT